MTTYQATELFTSEGKLVTNDPAALALKIIEAEIKSISSDHESKLIRIEIGAAIREIATLNNSTLTDIIVEMDLCRTTHRAEKTFLKYARIAGSPSLMKLAENPQISLSVLDEIASCKKPVIKEQEAEFLKRVVNDVTEICVANRLNEGYGPEEGSLIVLGITRNESVGVIRRNQILMGVQTKAGGNPEKPGEREIQSKILQLVNLMRIFFLPPPDRDGWFEKHGIVMADAGATMIALQNDLTAANIIPELATDLRPETVTGLRRLVQKQEDLQPI